VTVSDSAGCNSSLLELVVPYVYNDCFFFPDAFTPNDDGINDVYEISSTFTRQPLELSIFDKFGSLIFFSDEELKWDGTFKGNKCQSGKYYYVLKFANQYTTGDLLLLE
ncbi:T9SS type B sorting domain-containing protein, partial [bacterium]|nr:T9SS type B sorting domain-containing protein [bacterium]